MFFGFRYTSYGPYCRLRPVSSGLMRQLPGDEYGGGPGDGCGEGWWCGQVVCALLGVHVQGVGAVAVTARAADTLGLGLGFPPEVPPLAQHSRRCTTATDSASL